MGEDVKLLRDTLAALDMPPDGLAKWFRHSADFCRRHGGERIYGEWLEIWNECLAAIEDPDAS